MQTDETEVQQTFPEPQASHVRVVSVVVALNCAPGLPYHHPVSNTDPLAHEYRPVRVQHLEEELKSSNDQVELAQRRIKELEGSLKAASSSAHSNHPPLKPYQIGSVDSVAGNISKTTHLPARLWLGETEFMISNFFQANFPWSPEPASAYQQYYIIAVCEGATLHVHSRYFLAALREESLDPFRHKFALSVQTILRSTYRLISSMLGLYRAHPEVAGEQWQFWSPWLSACSFRCKLWRSYWWLKRQRVHWQDVPWEYWRTQPKYSG
ncbi:hypothetical protein FIBSPDRAFT_904794 [Athelia psychrophila]|uniref:Uncharacterized protein n=1 Tax=Athelia psychrophila TaxID=1759441 RepID=A0A167UA20_9AGAM|nr:hypothetical protein FIBSPDRAFT_904794 [Fibularhizoctonia sp. CBS 109695]